MIELSEFVAFHSALLECRSCYICARVVAWAVRLSIAASGAADREPSVSSLLHHFAVALELC